MRAETTERCRGLQRGGNEDAETRRRKMEYESPDSELTRQIIGCAIEVHKTIGPGLKEEVYELALEWELRQKGIPVRRQVKCPVVYKGVRLATTREDKAIDLLVDERVVVELKATPVMESASIVMPVENDSPRLCVSVPSALMPAAAKRSA